MGYRDELEASRARAAALERELADKHAEIDDLQDELSGKKEREEAARREQKAAARAARRKLVSRSWVWIIAAVVGLAGVGAGVFWCVRSLSQKLDGQFVATGSTLGDRVLRPHECDSGQRHGFRGVDLFAQDLRLRLVESLTQGPLVVIQRGDTKLAVLGKAQCTTLVRVLSNTHTTVNGIKLVDGSLELDCTLAEGGTLRGKVSWENCR